MEETVILKGAKVAVSATEAVKSDIAIHRGKICALGSLNGSTPALNLDGFLILPGLVNAHDHLEFNLFPRLGRRVYPNAAAWAEDIYHPQESPICQHLNIPRPVRLVWGGVKNLISGVTSVSHHNPYEEAVFRSNFPVRVVRRFGWAHSLTFCSDVEERFRRTPRNAPFLIHAGEGTDELSRNEFRTLEAAGVLNRRTVIVHGVALEASDNRLLTQRGASLVWCPTSNLFLLGRTLEQEILSSSLPIALGSDSALTAEGDLLDEIHAARRYVDLHRIYGMVTEQAASILRLTRGEGMIREGGIADLVVTRDRGQTPAEALLELRPEIVFLAGRMKLVSLAAADHLRLERLRHFQPITVEGRGKWLIDCDVSSLQNTAFQSLGNDVRLAGRRIAV